MATELDNILIELCEREKKAGCYDCTVGGIHAYNLVRFKVRNDYLSAKGMHFVESSTGANFWNILKSLVLSLIHFIKIVLLNKHYDVLFYPFLRLDKVGDSYLDKFTDPLIECCSLKKNFIIFYNHIEYLNSISIYK